MNRGSNPGRARDLPRLQNVQTGSVAHPASYSVGIRVPSQGLSGRGREVDHSPPSSPELKNEWSYTSTPPIMPSWRGQGQL
jgi:hypothetical protein